MILRSRGIVVLPPLLVVERLLVALVVLLLLLLRLLDLEGSRISISKSSRQSFKSHLMRTGHRCSMVLLRWTLCSRLRRPRVIGWPGGWWRLVGRRHNAFLLQEWVYT